VVLQIPSDIWALRVSDISAGKMTLPDIVAEAVAVVESSHRGERDVEEAQIRKAPKDLNQGASKSRALRLPGVDCIEGNAILDEDLLRRHFHNEKSLNKILNSLKYATSLEGQVLFDPCRLR
jgi:hypothetical protein